MKSIYSICLAVLFVLLCYTGNAFSAEAKAVFSWQPSPETDLAGYKIYYGTQSGVYLPSIDVGNVTTYTITGLSEGIMYYGVLTAYDASENESGYSSEAAAIKADMTAPGTPAHFTFTIQ